MILLASDYQEAKNINTVGDDIYPNTNFKPKLTVVNGPTVTWIEPPAHVCALKNDRLVVVADSTKKVKQVAFTDNGKRIGVDKNGTGGSTRSRGTRQAEEGQAQAPRNRDGRCRPQGRGGPRAQRLQVAVVTGASSGIGAELVRALQARGTLVVGLSRRPSEADEHEECDVADRAAVEAAAARVLERHPRIDLLVNNAGVGARGNFLTLDAGADRAGDARQLPRLGLGDARVPPRARPRARTSSTSSRSRAPSRAARTRRRSTRSSRSRVRSRSSSRRVASRSTP